MKQYFGTPLYQWVILGIGIIVSNIITDQFVLPWWAKLLVFGAVFFWAVHYTVSPFLPLLCLILGSNAFFPHKFSTSLLSPQALISKDFKCQS